MKEKGWCIKVYGETIFWRRIVHNYRPFERPNGERASYDFMVHRRESWKKFMNEEIKKYEEIRRYTYEDDLY